MVIACANVANVMLARGMARQREIGVRLALGAARGRLVRQLLTESALLSVPSALIGYLLSRGGVWLGVYLMFAATPPAYRPYIRLMPLAPDTRIVMFTMLSGVVAAVLFGLAPALQATRPSIVHATRGDFDSQLRPSKMRSVLVVAQIASSALLLICAGVLLRVARETRAVSPGIRTRNIVQLLFLDRARGEAIRALRASPGVTMVASGDRSPLDGTFTNVDVGPLGRPVSPAKFNLVSPDYFATLDLHMIRGRAFTDDEARARAPVAVVSEAMSRALWPEGDAIGQHLVMPVTSADRLRLGPYRDAIVVGVVANAAPGSIVVPATTPVIYYPQPVDAAGAAVLARTAADAETSRAAIERMLDANDSVAVQEVHTLDASLAVQVYPFTTAYWIASFIGGVALLLTVTGVYGVLSYIVAQRTREFGVRLALGAMPAGVIGLALRQLARLALVGLACGAFLALLVSRAVASMLELIDTYSLAGYAIGLGVVFAACLCAAYVPARRAATVNPVDALRADS
jgi:predicted permease